MKKIGCIFPGQSAQYVGMGKEIYDHSPHAREVFLEAEALLGQDWLNTIFQGPLEKLSETVFCQTAIFVTSIALLRHIERQVPHFEPHFCAGLSLGEYSALVAAKKLSFSEGLHLLKKRAEFMQEACQLKKGTMVAVLGLSLEKVQSLIQGMDEAWVCNHNEAEQVVVGCSQECLEKVQHALGKSAKRVIPLKVSGAFHTPFMKSAQEKLTPYLTKANFTSSSIAVVNNVEAKVLHAPDEIKTSLIQQITSPILWYETIQYMQDQVEVFLEIGPGRTLAGLNRRMKCPIPTSSIENFATTQKVAAQLC